MGKDGTQLLRHCVRLLVLVSTDLLSVRLSGIVFHFWFTSSLTTCLYACLRINFMNGKLMRQEDHCNV